MQDAFLQQKFVAVEEPVVTAKLEDVPLDDELPVVIVKKPKKSPAKNPYDESPPK